jgi:hypothetical protein
MNEDQREKLQLFLSRLGLISPSRWIISISVVILVGVLLSVWTNYGFVIVTTPTGIDNKSPIKYTNSDDRNQSLMNIGPVVFVPRTNSALVVSAGTYHSVMSVSIPWYGFVSTTLPVGIVNGIEKYSIDSSGCANYDSENDRLIDYICQNPINFSVIDLKTGSSKIVTPLLPMNQSVPFLNGLIGTTDNSTGQLLYQDYSGATTYLKKPDDLSVADLIASTIVTDHNDVANSSFIIQPLSGNIYIGNYSDNKVTYSKIPHLAEWNTKMSSVCRLLQTSAYCYQGISGLAPSNSDALSANNTISGRILKIDVSTPSKITLQQYSVPPTVAIEGIYIANDGNFTVLSTNRLYNFNFSGNTTVFHQLTGNIKSVTSTGDSVYFAKDNMIYKLQNSTAVAVFYSDDLNIDRVFSDNRSVFITAKSSMVGTELGIYKLTPTVDNVTKLLLHITMRPTQYSEDISDINFVKKNVFIRVKITIDKKATRADLVIDQNEYNQVKNHVSQQLQNAGLKTSDLNLVYSY